MMMKYSMEATIEAARLEEQVFQINYSIAKELKNIQFTEDEVVLDAGCGTGVLSRQLVDGFGVKKIDAIDCSDLRLKQGQDLLNERTRSSITFHRQDLTKIDPQFYGKYDTVICRFVIEHMNAPDQAMRELQKCLKSGGRLIISELDGVFANLYTENVKLTQYLDEFLKKVSFDLFIGRKVPNMMKRIGLEKITWEATLAPCTGKSLEEEVINTEKRFAALGPFLADLFGSGRDEEFKKLYLQEMRKTENTLVFTKYTCVGIKA
jgi:ubiquinone/menaquinone biosynthesis C-methylase UbiE